MPPKRRSSTTTTTTNTNTPSRTTTGGMDRNVEEDHHTKMDVLEVGTPSTSMTKTQSKRKNDDNDNDNDDQNSIDTHQSMGSRSSARLKRKREGLTTMMTTTTNKILNFDTVMEEEEEEEGNEEEETTKTAPKQTRRSAKRTKLHHPTVTKHTNPEEEENDRMTTTRTNTSTSITLQNHHQDEDQDMMITEVNEDIITLDSSVVIVTNEHNTARIHHPPSSFIMADATAVRYSHTYYTTEETELQREKDVEFVHPVQVLPVPPPPSSPSSLLLFATTTTSTTTRRSAAEEEEEKEETPKLESLPLRTHGVLPKEDVVNEEEVPPRHFLSSIGPRVCDPEDTVVPVIENDPDMTTDAIRHPYHQSTLFWCFVLLVVQIVAYPFWINPILSSTVVFSRFLLDHVYRRSSSSSRRHTNQNLGSPNIVATTTTTSDDILSNTIWTIQQLQQELQTLTQQEQTTREELLVLLIRNDEDDTDNDNYPNNTINTSNITETIRYYETMIQNRIVELSKTIEQLEPFHSSSGKGKQSLKMVPHNETDRSKNLFLLDLSRSDFFDNLLTSNTSRNSNSQNQPSVHCEMDGENTTINEHVGSPLIFLQQDEMDLSLQELQNQIRDMIHTTIMTSTSTMEQIRHWIQAEIRNETILLRQQITNPNTAATAAGSTDDIVRSIVSQRIWTKQSDMEWQPTHDDDDGVNNDNIHNIDYASVVHGGTILYATPSLIHTLPIVNRILSWLQLRFYGHTAEMIITPKTTIRHGRRHHENDLPNPILGQCWSFVRNTPAMVVVRLGQSMDVSSVSIQHPLVSTTETAIQTFHVYGHEDIQSQSPWDHRTEQERFRQSLSTFMTDPTNRTSTAENGWYYLGTFVYDTSESMPGTNGVVQFPIQMNNPTMPPLRIVRLEIDPILIMDTDTTNTAKRPDYKYSCLYRFRVHGVPSSSSSTTTTPVRP